MHINIDNKITVFVYDTSNDTVCTFVRSSELNLNIENGNRELINCLIKHFILLFENEVHIL